MEGRRCRWLDRTRRTCGSGSWRRWKRVRRPRWRRGGLPAGAPRGDPGGRAPPAGGGAAPAREEGGGAAKRRGGAPKPKISGEVAAALLGVLGETNHLTLAECRDRLAERTGVRVHPWTVGRALRRCGWT